MLTLIDDIMSENRMDEFYTFTSKMSSTTVNVYPNLIQYVKLKARLEEVINNKLIRGDINDMNVPLQYWIRGGSKYKDVLDMPWLSAYIISDRFKQIL